MGEHDFISYADLMKAQTKEIKTSVDGLQETMEYKRIKAPVKPHVDYDFEVLRERHTNLMAKKAKAAAEEEVEETWTFSRKKRDYVEEKPKPRPTDYEYEELMRPFEASKKTRRRAASPPMSSSEEEEEYYSSRSQRKSRKSRTLTSEYESDSSTGVEFTSSRLQTTRTAGTIAPTFQLRMKNHVVPAGMNARFCPCVYSRPLAEISWFKNNIEIFASSKYIITNHGGALQLEVTRCGPEDSATYSCRARNVAGEITDSARLDVTQAEFKSTSLVLSRRAELLEEGVDSTMWSNISSTASKCSMRGQTGSGGAGAPYFVIEPKRTICKSGESINFTAQCEGEPLPKVYWTFNGMKIRDDGTKTHIGAIRGKRTLDIKNCTVGDSGEYSCVAQNTKGQAVVNFSLEVMPTTSSRALAGAPSGRPSSRFSSQGPYVVS